MVKLFLAGMSRKQWSKESMAAALQSVREGTNVREVARLYNLPFETLRRRVVEKVPLECRSGPKLTLRSTQSLRMHGLLVPTKKLFRKASGSVYEAKLACKANANVEYG